MSEKSFVTIEKKVCLVCAQAYDSGALLMDKRGHKTFERETITGWGRLCPHCEKLEREGYIAVVEVKNRATGDSTLKPEDAERTGRVAYIRREAWNKVITIPCPTEALCFFPEGAIAMLEKMGGGHVEH